MKLKKSILILTLFVVGICLMGAVNAVSDNATDIISEIDFNDEISVSNNEHTSNIESDSVLSAQENSDDLSVIDEKQLSSLDDEDDDLCEDDDEDELDDELDEDDINEYIEDIKASTSEEYFKFFTYLIKQKGFIFNINSAGSDDGYTIYASQTFEGKLYDGSRFVKYAKESYFISTGDRKDYILDTYYPDIIYSRNDVFMLDEEYLGWLKWEENYSSINLSQSNKDVRYAYSNSYLNLPSEFNLYNLNYTTSIKNQGKYGNCWAFASIAALESYLLKNEGNHYNFSNNLDFSENNLKNVMSSLGKSGSDFKVNDGGNANMALAYFLRWSGPILETQDSYINNDIIEDYKAFKHVQGVKYISPRQNSLDNDEIKQAVLENGGVVTSIWWDSSPFYENGKNYYFFQNSIPYNVEKQKWHEICIVGWDDNYSKDNFVFKSSDVIDGAFIVKNSWGSDVGDKGYYYVSYCDTTLARYGERELCGSVGFSFTSVENNDNYGKNYYYNPLGTTFWASNFNEVSYRNKWTANCDEILKACGVYVNTPVNCSVDVIVDNNKVGGTTNVNLNYSGFHTVIFNNPVNIINGQTFAIQVNLKSNNGNIGLPLEVPLNEVNCTEIYSKASSNSDESSIYHDGNWIDINDYYGIKNCNLCINAYTEYVKLISTKIVASDLTMKYGENKAIVATLFDIDNNKLKNRKVTFCIAGLNHVVITNDDGKASIVINKNPGNYNVNIHYFGDEKFEESMKSIKLIVDKPTKKTTKIYIQECFIGNKQLKIQFSDGKLLEGEKITINIGGKSIYKKIDHNGEIMSIGRNY